LTAAGLLALMAAAGIGALWPQPAAAQFFDWGRSDWNRPQPRPQPQQPSYNPFQQLFSSPYRPPRPQDRGTYQRSAPAPAAPAQQADYSKAPPPHKPDVPPTATIAVVGDAMADWLAYGLEDAFGDTPEIGIVRKNRTYSGLIRYDPRSDTDWARAARELLTTDKPNYVVMMIGLNDRQSLRERVPTKPAAIRRPRNPLPLTISRRMTFRVTGPISRPRRRPPWPMRRRRGADRSASFTPRSGKMPTAS
jgi:hypothetical protein